MLDCTEPYEVMKKDSRIIPTRVVSQELKWARDRKYSASDEQSHDTCQMEGLETFGLQGCAAQDSKDEAIGTVATSRETHGVFGLGGTERDIHCADTVLPAQTVFCRWKRSFRQSVLDTDKEE